MYIKNNLTICSIIAVRNELKYLKILLPLLAEQNIDVVIIDNGSTDGSHDLYSDFMGKPVILVESLPYQGFFSLSKQLAYKSEIRKKINHDWVIHQDADEVMEHHLPGLTLRDAIQEADNAGYNILNFDEFTFLPEPNADYTNRNYYTEILRYYHFEPEQNRLNRAWKRSAQFSNMESGGHLLHGKNHSIWPINHILRHYIVLSAKHAKDKYINRSFDDAELAKGWHENRKNITRQKLTIPGKSNYLYKLKEYNSKMFYRENRVSRHYWEWK
jgi:glycosyltransferase involved in cell wall biosynthesis